MIHFEVKKKQKKYKHFLKMSEEQRLKYDMCMSIWVDNQQFFWEPDFPVLDFLYNAYKWKLSKDNEDFFYNCIETEDNPLISFTSEKNLWGICSPWQLFECEKKFTKEELVNAFDVLEKTINTGND